MLPTVYEVVPLSQHSLRKRAILHNAEFVDFYEEAFNQIFYHLIGNPMTLEELSLRLGRSIIDVHLDLCWLMSHAFIRIKPPVRKSKRAFARAPRPSFSDRFWNLIGGVFDVASRSLSNYRARNSSHAATSGRRLRAA